MGDVVPRNSGVVAMRTNRSLRRFVSRISFRLMAFNSLLVFLPVAGILYLSSYESKLLVQQRHALEEEARLLSGAVSASPSPEAAAQRLMVERLRLGAGAGSNDPVRLRVISVTGHILADSHLRDRPPAPPRASPARRNVLYRTGAALMRPVLALFRATEPDLPESDYYERAARLDGPEIASALRGRPGRVERISPDRRSVTVYAAEPIRIHDRVVGAALASQSTFTILQDLYTVRLGIVRIFAVSVLLAFVLSFLVATTIVRPLRQLRVEAGAILDRQGRLRGRFHGTRKHDEIGDLSRALERLTRRLDERVRFIESFAADVSHEFKNPLASIRTATEMLAEVDEPQQRSRFLRIVEREIARMESLLSGVREITSIDAQLTTEERHPVDVRTILQTIVDGFRLRENAQVSIDLEAPAEPCVVIASEDRLIQVFVNILENAISFSPAGGVVTIKAMIGTGMVETVVSDEGPGIPETNLQRVFERFFTHRRDEPRSRASHTGLGLAIVKAIVEGYGGTVSAVNGGKGGARFEVRLPAA
jgi:two-component system sensor histidine kinase ChvG